MDKSEELRLIEIELIRRELEYRELAEKEAHTAVRQRCPICNPKD